MADEIRCLMACGANQGDCESALHEARRRLAALPGIHDLRASELWVTEAIGGPAGQSKFLNGAFVFDTTLMPAQLHRHMLSIESQLGRKRTTRWGPRKIDLDLLLYGGTLLNDSDLVLPHPRMTFRRFVLGPATEVAPAMVEPISGCTISELLRCLDQRQPWVTLEAFVPGTWRATNTLVDADWLASLQESITSNSGDVLLIAGGSHAESRVVADWFEAASRGTALSHQPTLIVTRAALSASEDASQVTRVERRPKLRVACPLAGDRDPAFDVGVAEDEMGRIGGPYLDLRQASAKDAAVELMAAIEAMN